MGVLKSFLNSTPCTDGFNRQVHIRNKNSYVTNCIGLFKAFDFLRQSGGYDLLKNIIAPPLPTKSAGASALSSATSSNVLPAF